MRSPVRSALFVAALPFSFAALPNATDETYRAPLMTWFAKFFEGAQVGHYKPGANLDIPAVWLFSPEGRMVSRFTIDNESELASLADNFPPSAPKPLADEPSLDALRASLVSASGIASPEHLQDRKWTAVLFLSDSSACEHCAPFEQKISELEHRSSDRLTVMRVTLTD
jgi:hypothetical protein